METRKEMKVFQVAKRCPKCVNGDMEFNGEMDNSNPARYHHRCTSCGYPRYYSKIYPYLEHKELNIQEDEV
jgi:predicted nucleic-acid-binding Zn-ribbon protein